MRAVGTLGAIAPRWEVGRGSSTQKQTNVDDGVSSVENQLGVSRVTDEWKGAMKERDVLTRSAMKQLTRVLNDESLSAFHMQAVQSIVLVFRLQVNCQPV